MKRVTHSLIVWSRRSAANHGAGYCMNVSMLLISRGSLLKHALMKGFMCAPRNKPIKSCSLQENKNKIWKGSTELEQQSPVTLFAITGARHWTWETFFIIFLNIFYRLSSLPPRSCHQEAEVMTQMPSVSLTPCPVLLFIAGFIAVFLRPQLRQSLSAWSLIQTHREDSPGQGLTVCKRGLQSASGVWLVAYRAPPGDPQNHLCSLEETIPCAAKKSPQWQMGLPVRGNVQGKHLEASARSLRSEAD